MIKGLRKLADKLEQLKFRIIISWNNFLDKLKM